ncbi:hypothetical protein BDF22DRAFT_684825 [Syncephalis plumigaleata]|nr:hypothetical protein BDF22DRAFT_684825 [Syncephalis plumigaleata]
MTSLPVKKKDTKKKKKGKTILSFSLDEDNTEETFQLKKNVVSTVATDHQREVQEETTIERSVERKKTSVASLYGYDPTLHQRRLNDEQDDPFGSSDAIPDAATIEAAKKQRARRRKMADWKHSHLVGDNDVDVDDGDNGKNTVQFLVTDKKTRKETLEDALASTMDDTTLEGSEPSDDEEFNAFVSQQIDRATAKPGQKPKRAKHIPPTATPIPQVTPCPVIDQVIKSIKTTAQEAEQQLQQDQIKLEKTRIIRDQTRESLASLTKKRNHVVIDSSFLNTDLIDTKTSKQSIVGTITNAAINTWFDNLCNTNNTIVDTDQVSDSLTAMLVEQHEKAASDLDYVLKQRDTLFMDTDSQYSSMTAVQDKFNSWTQSYPEEYTTAYIDLCLPPVFDFYIRMALLEWIPFSNQDGPGSLKSMTWFKTIEEANYAEVKMVIGTILRKTVLPQVSLNAYLPYKDEHTQWLLDLIAWFKEYDVVPKKFATLLEERLQVCLDALDELLKSNQNDSTINPDYLINLNCMVINL